MLDKITDTLKLNRMACRHSIPVNNGRNLPHFYGPVHKTIRAQPKDKFTDLTNTFLDSIVEVPEGENHNLTMLGKMDKSYYATYSTDNVNEYNDGENQIQVNLSTMSKHKVSNPSNAKENYAINRTYRAPVKQEKRIRSATVCREERKEQLLIKIKKSIFSETSKERNCILHNGVFRYYDQSTLKGVIDFTIVNAKIEYSLKRPSFRIRIENSIKNFDFLIPSNAKDPYKIRDQWIKLLHMHIQNYKCSLRKKPRLPLSIQMFWKYDRISESQFVCKADTGDILLFRTHNIGSKMQRFVTRSKYDHTAMILRYNNNRIMILEATSNEVCILIRGGEYLRMERFRQHGRAIIL